MRTLHIHRTEHPERGVVICRCDRGTDDGAVFIGDAELDWLLANLETVRVEMRAEQGAK